MTFKGHIGMSLLVAFGALAALGLRDEGSILTALIAIACSTLPDVDIRLELKHRKYTHNLLASLLFGLLMGFIFSQSSPGFAGGFLGGFAGSLLHIAGDLMTLMPFNPLYPVPMKPVSLKLFRSNNRLVNGALYYAGIAALAYYVVFVYLRLQPQRLLL
ncbi:MAG: hypothetical protein DRJ56_03870 [Thermoprotei archaeon]|nr:MAG: hypothetical protein DRJ56_03870 [Thermoprotei archaeon]